MSGRPSRAWRRTQEIVRRVLWQRELFAALQAAGQEPPGDSQYVRWIDRVEIGSTARPALFMHPESSRTFTIRVPRGGWIHAAIGLLSEAWEKNRDGVVFSISASSPQGSLREEGQWTIGARSVRGDCTWRSVGLPLGRLAGQEVHVRFATSLPAGASPEYAWAVWGDPEVWGRRALGALARRQIEAILTQGLRATLRRWRAVWAPRGGRDERYALWLVRHGYTDLDVGRLRSEAAGFQYQPVISLITPVFNVAPAWLRRCVESVESQTYPHWELCLCDDGSSYAGTIRALARIEGRDRRIKVMRLPAHQGISAASNRALSAASGEFIGLLDHDDELTQDALHQVVRCLNEHPDADLIYSDDDKLEADGSPAEPCFKPDWSPEYLRSVMYIGHLAVYRRNLVDAVGGFRSEFDGSQDYDLALRAAERTNRIVHIPRILYHWRKISASAAGDISAKPWAHAAGMRALADHLLRLGLSAEAVDVPGGGFRRVQFRIIREPQVSIIISRQGQGDQAADAQHDVLMKCVRSIVEKTSYAHYEVVIVDSGRMSAAAGSELVGVRPSQITVVEAGSSEPSAMMNAGVRLARGEHLVFLHDDIEVIGDDWLGAMLEYSQQREIGAVGAKLYDRDGRLQHIGIILGINGSAGRVFRGHAKDHPGYYGGAWVIRNYSAVSGACLMTRRAVFEEVGGFGKHFPARFVDIDYCLRADARGYRTVFTPFAELRHHEMGPLDNYSSRPSDDDIRALNARWPAKLENDPFYNPNLSRDGTDYQLRS